MEKLTAEEKQKFLENEGLIYFASKKYNIEYDLCCIGMCKAIKRYNEAKGQFSTYAIKCMQGEKYMELRKQQRQVSETLNIDIPLLERRLTYEIKDSDFASDLFEKIIRPCTKMQKEILKLHYVDNLKFCEIAKQLGKTTKCVMQHAIRGRQKIKNRFVTANKNINQFMEEI